MRSDVILYVVAAIFFALSILSIILFPDPERFIWIILNVVLGIISIGSGYYLRPKPKPTIKKISQIPIEQVTQSTTVESTSAIEDPITESIPKEPTTIKEPVVIDEAQIEETPPTESVPVEITQTTETTTETTEPLKETITSPQQEPTLQITQDNKTPAQAEQEETPLTNIKGIGEKRAAQLNALGINTAKKLAQTSADDLAKSLKISPKIAAKLIEAAKQQ